MRTGDARAGGSETPQAVFARFVDHVRNHDRVWVCRRIDVARHWREHHPWPG